MKQADVQVGGIYRCYVSGALIRVEVLEKVKERGFGSRRNKTRFRVKNVATGKELPKFRSAAALRPLGKKVKDGELLDPRLVLENPADQPPEPIKFEWEKGDLPAKPLREVDPELWKREVLTRVERPVDEWFHHFYRSEEVRRHPVTKKFGIFYRPAGYRFAGWYYDFKDEREAHMTIDFQLDTREV
ncbi:MAG: hypothetical protein JSU72_15220 [Deltaproteobacteria bacterium]|nr:MAG: hypothetical protein JSU72_15220 [Deltaproteobacteria bacterium]